MPLARRARRVPGLAPRGGSRIRTGGDALAAAVLAALAVSICSGIIAVAAQLAGGELRGARPRLPARRDRRAFLFGLRAGILTAVAATAVFDAVLLPPAHFKTPDSRVWLLFAALLLSGVAVAELAARERRRSEQAYEREREAALLAGLSSALVGGASLALAQIDAARVAAAAIGVPAARIVLGRGPLAGQVALPLDVDGRVIGRLELMGASDAVLDDEIAQRVARSLAGVLALAQERERLAHADVEAQALRASDALKTALLRAVSHELRTPLTAIKAAVGALRGDQVQLGEEAVRELLEDVSIETDRLDRLVSDLLDVSRLQAGRASTALDWCEVDDLVRGAVAAARSRAPGTRIEIETQDGLPLVHCDASQIERVLVNLIENAAKFSPADEPVTCARTRCRRPCRDHGRRPRSGHRAGPARARVRAVLPRARRRRGRDGAGPRDRARVRRGQRRNPDDRRCSRWRHVHARRAAEHEGQRGGAGVSGSGARVLVVDDERAIQRALKATLEAAGYHVDVVGTCADALAQVALKPPDLVLLDLLLPDGTGDDVAREIRTWSNVPILLVSAVGDEREKVKALDAGADDYVTKPFGIDELLARVRAMQPYLPSAARCPPVSCPHPRDAASLATARNGCAATDSARNPRGSRSVQAAPAARDCRPGTPTRRAGARSSGPARHPGRTSPRENRRGRNRAPTREGPNRTSISGCCRVNSARRGKSQRCRNSLHAEVQHAADPLPPDALDGAAQFVEPATHSWQQLRAFLRQGHGAGMATKQRHANVGFE